MSSDFDLADVHIADLFEDLRRRMKQVQSPQIEAVLLGALATTVQAMVLYEINAKLDHMRDLMSAMADRKVHDDA